MRKSVSRYLGFLFGGRASSKAPWQAASKTQTVGSASRHGTPDLALSTFSIVGANRLDLAAISCRGRGHYISGESRQDSFTVFTTPRYLVAAISDGVSSANLSHVGSSLVTAELPGVFEKVFHDKDVTDEQAWFEVNQILSKNLVRTFVGRQREAGLGFPADLNSLREVTADHFATTLEVAVIPLDATVDGNREFTCVTICGDGGVFYVRKGLEIFRASHSIEKPGGGKSRVAALPVNDGLPKVTTERLAAGDSVILCTDGVADFLPTSEIWKEHLFAIIRKPDLSNHDLIDFITLEIPEAFDDKTAIIIRS